MNSSIQHVYLIREDRLKHAAYCCAPGIEFVECPLCNNNVELIDKPVRSDSFPQFCYKQCRRRHRIYIPRSLEGELLLMMAQRVKPTTTWPNVDSKDKI